jgi:DNA-directed RNA polymerase subunit RPC12/RpoP
MKCPHCGSGAIVDGSVIGTDNSATRFTPTGMRLLVWERSIELTGGSLFYACSDCGHLWNRINPVTLRNLVAHGGTDRLKRKVFVKPRGPGEQSGS